jgi:hypothetical protein
MGKKTLYLDLDGLERIEASLAQIPGRPSLSSFLSDQFPVMGDSLEQMVALINAPSATPVTFRVGLNEIADGHLETLIGVKKMLRDVPPEETVLDVPASKPKRQKKLA